MGLKKGARPERFNEEPLEASSTQSIAMSQYNVQSFDEGSRKVKVNLRSINNAAERDVYRKL